MRREFLKLLSIVILNSLFGLQWFKRTFLFEFISYELRCVTLHQRMPSRRAEDEEHLLCLVERDVENARCFDKRVLAIVHQV